MKNKVLLTGNPGVGKTTIIMKVIKDLKNIGGFYTMELREGGERVGFEMITLITGKRGMLAHKNFDSIYRVGKYGVNVETFEKIVCEEFSASFSNNVQLIVVDEIGRMELFSKKFMKIVEDVLKKDVKVLGVIQKRRNPFLDRIRNMKEVEILEVNHSNRDEVFKRIKEWLGF